MQGEEGAPRRTAEGGPGRSRRGRTPSAIGLRTESPPAVSDSVCGAFPAAWGHPHRRPRRHLFFPRGVGRCGVDFKRLLITSMLDRVSVVLFCLFLSWEFYSNFHKIYTCTHTQQSGKVQEVVNFCVL